MIKPLKYTCPNCGSRTCITDEISTTGKLITRILNIQYKRFTSVICTECKYTEFYHISHKKIGDVLDIQVKTFNIQ
jgi:predicted nucleic-acid-binding Zn-ribbon protein